MIAENGRVGLKLHELGSSSEEVAFLAQRMINMGRAIYYRLFLDKSDERSVRESDLAEGGKIREMILVVSSGRDPEYLRLYAMIPEQGSPMVGATLHPFSKLFSKNVSIDLGSIRLDHLHLTPAEAAHELTYATPMIEAESSWQVLLYRIGFAAPVSEEFPNAPWGIPEKK